GAARRSHEEIGSRGSTKSRGKTVDAENGARAVSPSRRGVWPESRSCPRRSASANSHCGRTETRGEAGARSQKLGLGTTASRLVHPSAWRRLSGCRRALRSRPLASSRRWHHGGRHLFWGQFL